LSPPPKNLIVEVISGPEGVELKSYVVENGITRTFGGVRGTSQLVTAINDPAMSRFHFQVINEKGKVKLKDCNSKNGTKLDGRKVTEETISAGAIFKAGRTRFQVRWEKIVEESDEDPSPSDQPVAQSNQGQPLKAKEDLNIISPESEVSNHDSSLESSLVVGPSSCFRKSGTNLSGVVKRLDAAPEDVSDETDHSIPDISSVESVVRMMKVTGKPIVEFKETIQALANHLDFFVIVHLAKINLNLMPSIKRIPLYPHLDPKGSAFPVAIQKTEWFSHLHSRFAERLIALDGLILVTYRPKSEGLEECLTDLGVAAVPGFSERGGFVPWCWPSGVANVLESMPDATIATWLGVSLSGLIFLRESRIVAHTIRDQVEVLDSLDFR